MSLKSNDFVNRMKRQKREVLLCLAKITEVTNGQVYLTFYGEEIQSEKSYKILSSYNPKVGDTVCAAKINSSWLVLGKISTQYSDNAGGIPEDHASTTTIYGKGTSGYYGHVKLSDSTSLPSDAASGGIAATPKAVKEAYDLANEAAKKKIASAYGSASSLSVPAWEITMLTLDTWDVKSDDTFRFNGGGIQCPYDGYIFVSGNIYFKSNGSTGDCRRGVYIKKNGSEIQSQYLDFKENAEGIVGSGIGLAKVNAGDVITMHARQSTETTCSPGAKSARLIVAYI